MENKSKPCELILALDVATKEDVYIILDSVGDTIQWVKVGLQLYLRYGSTLVENIAARGYHVFLDLKLHDIPNTVASAINNLKGLPISMLTLHTSGGKNMMAWAREAQEHALPDTRLLGVTILTSIDQSELQAIGYQQSIENQVKQLGELAMEAGIHGLVCSPHELKILRSSLNGAPMLVTPGIRPLDKSTDDQKRIMTPAQAAKTGSSFIVVGRPILKATNRKQAAINIVDELNRANGSELQALWTVKKPAYHPMLQSCYAQAQARVCKRPLRTRF